MDFRPVERAPGAFQQPISAEELQTICHRAFGIATEVTAAVELGGGMYNNTYKVEIVGREKPVIVRVAPEPDRQFRSEHQLMRNEYASVPYLAVIAPFMPKIIAADWSREIVGRDWMIQSLLEGVAAPERLGDYPRHQWPAFFRQLGEIARSVHEVKGPHFGPVTGPKYTTWSEAVAGSLRVISADLDDAGLDSADVRQVAEVVAGEAAVFDEIATPRLLPGDLWTVNTMLHPSAPEPVITGVLDMDRCWFGDPAADWTIRMALAKNDERTAFWERYGPLAESAEAKWRSLVYEVRHLGAIRLERHRLGNGEGVQASYGAVAELLKVI